MESNQHVSSQDNSCMNISSQDKSSQIISPSDISSKNISSEDNSKLNISSLDNSSQNSSSSQEASIQHQSDEIPSDLDLVEDEFSAEQGPLESPTKVNIVSESPNKLPVVERYPI